MLALFLSRSLHTYSHVQQKFSSFVVVFGAALNTRMRRAYLTLSRTAAPSMAEICVERVWGGRIDIVVGMRCFFFLLYRVTPTRTTTSTVAFGEKETERVELTPFYAPINRNDLNKYTNTHTINYESRQIETIANCVEGNLRSYGLPPCPSSSLCPRTEPSRPVTFLCHATGSAIVEFNAAMDNYENFTTISIGREQRRNVDKS